jgi:hypothetical protein
MCTSYVIYILCAVFLKTPWFMVVVLGSVTVLSELPALDYFDDNGVMLLVPLAFSILLKPFITT